MFKDFWEKRKGIIEFVGIVCAVGALFLAIPIPSDPNARDALLNIQFIWLVFITIGVLTLFGMLWWFMYQLESEVNKMHRIFILQGSASFIIFGFIISFCINLWRYVLALYPQPLHSFEGTLAASGTMLVLGIALYFLNARKNRISPITFMIIDAVLWSLLFTLTINIGPVIANGKSFSVKTWLLTALSTFILMLIMESIKIWRAKKKFKAEQTSSSQIKTG